MILLSAAETARALPYGPLVAALDGMFAAGTRAPLRHHHAMPRPGEPDATLLLMPAWSAAGRHGAVKIVNVTPGNGARGLPAVTASVLVFDALTGEHLALVDGGTLTARRTAAVSALAASRLARRDSRHLLVVGAGQVAGEFAAAYRAVLPIDRVTVWNRDPARGAALVRRLRDDGFAATAAADLDAAVSDADVIATATLSAEPLVRGRSLRPGQHLDLVGSFTPAMREADDEAVARARVFIDTEAAIAESGDIARPLAAGVLTRDAIAGDLYALCGGEVPGRRSDDEITLFKAVGVAIADLAAAGVAIDAVAGQTTG